MKVKTSITLSPGVLALIDKHAKQSNRSVFVEEAVKAYVLSLARRYRDQKDLEIINRTAERLNQEAMDALDYQAEI
jgi:metal-responsive CopG/Arc/MetJ family transcriptional regulator